MRVGRRDCGRGLSIAVGVTVVAAAIAAARPVHLLAADALVPPPAGIGPRLVYLSSLRGHAGKSPDAARSLAASGAIAAAAEETQLVSIRFATPPSDERLASLAARGVSFIEQEGRRLHTRTVYPARASWDALAWLGGDGDIVQVESAWRPQHLPPLDVTRAQVQADVAWEVVNAAREHLTGEGITIADFDTGIDLYHPLFWRADGDTLRWIDADANGRFDAGTDAVDLDRDGVKDPGETLGVVEAPVFGGIENDAARYNARMDWLYGDRNGNGVRDAGPDHGFTEADPLFGEPVYITLDRNGNDALDPRERIVALRTCKVRAIHETSGTVRRRGVDLIASEGDEYGHGTQVAGILAGGTPGCSRFAGIAPGAELLMGNNVYVGEPPFIVSLETLIPWARNEGADVMLYEDGEWVWNYLDGSSNVEAMIDELAAEGIPQVVPSGNLATGHLHTRRRVPALGTADAVIVEPLPPPGAEPVVMWPSLLWRGRTDDIAVVLEAPDGSRLALEGRGEFETLGAWVVYSYLSRSPRGTAKMDIQVMAGPGGATLAGYWEFGLENRTDHAIDVHGYTWDNLSSWSGFGIWSPAVDEMNTSVTWPATADSAITVGSYRPRGLQVHNDFSGRGPRIDGTPVMDLSAPGTFVYTPAPREIAGAIGGYGAFGGTSAAGPHVAAGLALLRQLRPGDRPGDLLKSLRANAAHDALTGAVPNETWGWGRLRLMEAIAPFAHGGAAGATSDSAAAGSTTGGGPARALRVEVAPNPGGGELAITCALARPGSARVELFDLLGRRVAEMGEVPGSTAPREVTLRWDRALPGGGHLAAGTYVVRVTQGEESASAKVILLP